MTVVPDKSDFRLALPNWIIAGTPKAATSSLFQWLGDHPAVAATKEKETYYFSDPGSHMFRPDRNFRDHGLEGYATLFAEAAADAVALIEATPGYMYSETALRALPRLPSKPSFIFVLREPVSQLRSMYQYFRENWHWIPREMSFADFIAASEAGRDMFRNNELARDAVANAHYETALRRWRDACGLDRMHIILFEDLVSNRQAVMHRMASVMGLDPSFYDSYDFPVENASYAARSHLLQRLNILIRGRLPKGRGYDLLRRIYRVANTTSASRASVAHPELEHGLSYRFEPTLAALEAEFGLDMAPWRRIIAARHDAAVRHDGPGALSASEGTP